MTEPLGAVFVVLGLLAGLLWLVRRPALGRGRRGRHLLVLDTAPLATGQSLALVQVAGRCVLVGASNGRLENLAEFPSTELTERDGVVPGADLAGRSMEQRRQAVPLRWLPDLFTRNREGDGSSAGSTP